MKIIKPSFQIIDESSVTKKIEKVARICYKSEDKIAEGTDLKMVNNLIQRQHTAMLEHADLAVVVTYSDYYFIRKVMETMSTQCHADTPKPCYLRTTYHSSNENFGSILSYGQRYVVSGNMRAWNDYFAFAVRYGYGIQEPLFRVINEAANHIFDCFANGVGVAEGCQHMFSEEPNVELVDDYSKLSDAERMVHETVSVLFTVDRGVTHEMVRHRDCSFAQESTRYCNYSNGKHGNEITVIKPCFFEEGTFAYDVWQAGCEFAEEQYMILTEEAKATPQQARDILPTSVKAEIVMTTNLREWKHIFALRACDSTGPAHPQMKEIMIPCLEELQNKYAFAFGDLVPAYDIK